MTAYWCRFLDKGGRVYASEKLVAQSDAEAVAKVRAILGGEKRGSFELWDGTRQVDVEAAQTSEGAC
jgi:hypothetical protein